MDKPRWVAKRCNPTRATEVRLIALSTAGPSKLDLKLIIWNDLLPSPFEGEGLGMRVLVVAPRRNKITYAALFIYLSGFIKINSLENEHY